MPVTVRFDPTATSKQAQIIPDATLTSDGVMTKEMVSKLNQSGPGFVFVFRPGAVPPLKSNVYNDWAKLMEAVNAEDSVRTIEFDSVFAPCVIPAGIWDMNEVAWTGSLTSSVDVIIQEGVIFLKLRRVLNFIAIKFMGDTPPVQDLNGASDPFLLLNSSSVQCLGTGPFIRNSTPGNFVVMAPMVGAQFVTGTAPVFDLAAPGTVGVISVGNAGVVQPNTVSGVVGSTFVQVMIATSGFIDTNQPAFFGNNDKANIAWQRLNPSGPTSSSPNTNYNDLVRCKTDSGNVPVNLPPANNGRGTWVVVKIITPNVEGITVTVTPFAGDTIDGAPSAALTAPFGVLRLVSDGVSNWDVV